MIWSNISIQGKLNSYPRCLSKVKREEEKYKSSGNVHSAQYEKRKRVSFATNIQDSIFHKEVLGGFKPSTKIFVWANNILLLAKLYEKSKRTMEIPLIQHKNPVVSSVYSSRQLLHACIIKHSIVDYKTEPTTNISKCAKERETQTRGISR